MRSERRICGLGIWPKLIIDLDRPQEGLLQVSQQALIDLQQQLQVTNP